MVCYPTDLSPESCAIRTQIHADMMASLAAVQEARRQRALALEQIRERRLARGEVIPSATETRWEIPPRSLTRAQRKSLRYESSPTRDEQAAEGHHSLGHMPRMRVTDVWREDRDPAGAIRVSLQTLPPCAPWGRELIIAANGETERVG
jgi:hypothetical protein